MGAGSLIGPQYIMNRLGRRLTLIVFAVFGIASVLLSLVENISTICIGRILNGFCIGVFQTTGPAYLIETVPSYLMATFGPMINIGVNMGILAAALVGLVLPSSSDDDQILETSTTWRIVFAFPILFQVIMIFSLIFVYKHDSLQFLKGDESKSEDEIKALLKKVYRFDNDEACQRCFDQMNSADTEPANSDETGPEEKP